MGGAYCQTRPVFIRRVSTVLSYFVGVAMLVAVLYTSISNGLNDPVGGRNVYKLEAHGPAQVTMLSDRVACLQWSDAGKRRGIGF